MNRHAYFNRIMPSIIDALIFIGFNRKNVYETSKISRTPRLSKK